MTGFTLPALRRLPLPRGYAADVAVAVAVTAAQLAVTGAILSWHQHHGGAPGLASYPLLAASGLALTWRRRFPVAVLGVALATTLAANALGASVWIALIVAFVNAEVARKRAAAIASLVIGYVVAFWPPWRVGQPGHGSVEAAVAVASWLAVLLAVAELIRMRSQRAAAAARSADDQLRRRASEERVQIARDLHDVLAHNISVINVQANTALHLMDRQPERAREALTSIHVVSKQALAELRTVLGVLRADGEMAPRTPNPGLAQLRDLVSAVGAAGLDARLAVHGEPRELPSDVDVAGYRIVQEALTNTARHSVSQAAEVVVRYQPQGVLVQVDDDGPARLELPGVGHGPAGSGNGITGMSERAQAVGGTVSAAGRPDGGFRVVAWLPSAEVSAR